MRPFKYPTQKLLTQSSVRYRAKDALDKKRCAYAAWMWGRRHGLIVHVRPQGELTLLLSSSPRPPLAEPAPV